MAPETLEGLRPVVERPDRLDIGAVVHLPPLAPRVHQTDVAEHLEVFRDRGLSEIERRDQVADGPFAGRQVHQDVAAAGFGDGIEDVRVRGGARHGLNYIPITECVKPLSCVVDLPRILEQQQPGGGL